MMTARTAFFDTPIEYLKGVGPQRAEILKKELNIHSFGDLVQHYPFRYIDRTRFYKIKEIHTDLPYIQLRGKIVSMETVGAKRAQRLVALFADETGTIGLVWFQGIKWIKESIRPGGEYVVFGKPTLFRNKINIAHPEMEPVKEQSVEGNASLQAFYNTTEKMKAKGLDSKGIARLIKALFQVFPPSAEETLPSPLTGALRLIPYTEALRYIHLPADAGKLRLAQFRLKFQELFYIQMKLLQFKVNRNEKIKGRIFSKIGDHFNRFYKEKLPFPLTSAQKKVIREIRQDLGSGRQMNRLLQGDVGSGKTLVALMSMLIALDNRTQACMMAPTELLANQHYATLGRMLDGLPVRIGLLTGSVRTRERNELLEKLAEGKIEILIGTHAVIEERVRFKDLGLVVIDEQHRFGVEQRARLWMKNAHPPHVLVMTATPIPRTLAMTLYGDLDTSVIDELPPGRKPVTTVHYYESARLKLFEFIRKQIQAGRQVYIVYPLIEESEKMDYKDLMDGYESICRAFPLPRYRVSIVHGRQKAADRDFEMQRFARGETHIMVATTVIEVGVDVPNASVMVIESAERFGLSQLHQLRGRVGRGAEQSYCILMSSVKLSADARKRLETMVRTGNGFEIADVDLQLRGPGDMAGTRQSGILDLRIADLGKDQQILQLARTAAMKLLEEDPRLVQPENKCVANRLAEMNRKSGEWSRIL